MVYCRVSLVNYGDRRPTPVNCQRALTVVIIAFTRVHLAALPASVSVAAAAKSGLRHWFSPPTHHLTKKLTVTESYGSKAANKQFVIGLAVRSESFHNTVLTDNIRFVF